MTQPTGPTPLTLPTVAPTLPYEVDSAIQFIQRNLEPAEILAVRDGLQFSTGFETFALVGPLLILRFQPEALSADNPEVIP